MKSSHFDALMEELDVMDKVDEEGLLANELLEIIQTHEIRRDKKGKVVDKLDQCVEHIRLLNEQLKRLKDSLSSGKIVDKIQ